VARLLRPRSYTRDLLGAVRWATLLDRLPASVLPLIYMLLGAIFFLGWPTTNSQFIHFQF
jgi:hypothetical protein